MRIAYLDCSAGICGSMLIGALLDAGVEWTSFEKEIYENLNLGNFHIKREKILEKSISATRFEVCIENIELEKHRSLSEIKEIILRSSLSSFVKEQSIISFEALAMAEATIHNCSIEKVHFHEVGALDAIIDITGTYIGLELLGIKKIFAKNVNLGSGWVKCAHGTLPVPAPATLELLKGIPSYSSNIETELTTPTGAVLFKTLVKEFQEAPHMKLEKIGYGAGTKELTIPNLLRIRIGESLENTSIENLHMIECGLDDMTPEQLSHLQRKLEEAKALEVMLLPAQMKKSRLAFLLRVLCDQENFFIVQKILFQESSSLGVRKYNIERISLKRRIVSVDLEMGTVNLKIGYYQDKLSNIAPEYESCLKYAKENEIPLKEVYQQAITTFRNRQEKKN